MIKADDNSRKQELQFLDERVRKYRLQLADKSGHEASSEESS
jgi:hypothetical protein